MQYLKHKNIMLTRTAEQNEASLSLLESYAAKPVLFPCLNIEYLKQNIQEVWEVLRKNASENTDIIFSSRNGVAAVAACLPDFAHALSGFRLVAVGDKTASSLLELGCTVSMIPSIPSQKGLIAMYQQQKLPQKAFFFRALEGSDDLQAYLTSNQVATQLIPCYKTSCNTEPTPEVIQQLKLGQIDAVLLGSARTAACYVQRIKDINLANRPAIAVMSQQVAKAADKLGLDVQVIAKEPSFKNMLQGLNQYFAEQGNKHVI
jgi:uroporphyrinogen III methyltransferase/synthase